MTAQAEDCAGPTPRGYPHQEVGSGDSPSRVLPRAEHAIAAIRRGETVVLIDDVNDGVGVLLVAAECATPAAMDFIVRCSAGFICVGLPTERAAELGIPDMVCDPSGGEKAALSVSFDFVHGTTTGISAFDRSRTAMSLVDPGTRRSDLTRPGHLHALRAHDNGVLGRPGRAEAAVDLVRLAGLNPGGVLCELVTDDGLGLMRGADAQRFAAEQRLVAVHLSELVHHRRRTETQVIQTAEAVLSTEWAEFTCVTFESTLDDQTHYALVLGNPAQSGDPLVALHRECLAADVFGSTACDCARHLTDAMKGVAAAGEGVVLYLRNDRPAITIDHPCDQPDVADMDDSRGAVASQIMACLGIANRRPLMTHKAWVNVFPDRDH
jgi:3,4-dihydroxy 2-butanone 4-phosphate synthase / GTP cyclohydrolase II